MNNSIVKEKQYFDKTSDRESCVLIKWKTKYTTLSERFQNLKEKQNIPHCRNGSKIYKKYRRKKQNRYS